MAGFVQWREARWSCVEARDPELLAEFCFWRMGGPIKEINKVVRVKCRAMRDGSVGWATATGSNGVVFVEQKRVHFQAFSSSGE